MTTVERPQRNPCTVQGLGTIVDDMRYDTELLGSLVAAMIAQRPDVVAEIASWFRPEYLIDEFHQSLYTALVALAEDKAPVTDTTLARAMRAVGSKHKDVASVAKLITDWRGIWWHARWYAQQVHQDWLRHAASEDARVASGELLDPTKEPAEVLEHLGGIHNRYAPPTETRVTDNAAALHEILDEIENPDQYDADCVNTGLSDLDSLTGGWRPGSLIIVAARTSDGKSTFVGHVAANMVFNSERPVAFFATEMGNRELYKRWACWLSRCQMGRQPEYIKALAKLRVAPLHVFAGNRSIAQIETEARAYAKTDELSLIVVDYLQQVRPTLKSDSREQQVADMSRRLKGLAMECGVPVVVACQLNRQATQGPPKIHHIRDSGAVEQDADVVILLDPEHKTDDTTKTTIVVGKNRNGSKGVVDVVWQRHLFRYVDLAPPRFEAFDQFNSSYEPNVTNS